MKFLKCHPFPVAARFDRVLAFSFAFPEETLRPYVDDGLRIDSFQGLGFITVALVWTRQLRPAGFPHFMGRDFFLAGYRVFTSLRDESGRKLRGLKIIGSETDKHGMVFWGNLMTEYKYEHVRVESTTVGQVTRLLTTKDDGRISLDIRYDAETPTTSLPDGSPFADWREARRFAGPMPFTFSPWGNGLFLVIQGTRASWEPRPIRVIDWCVGLFDDPVFGGIKPILANAFAVENIEYRWERGKVIDTTKHEPEAK